MLFDVPRCSFYQDRMLEEFYSRKESLKPSHQVRLEAVSTSSREFHLRGSISAKHALIGSRDCASVYCRASRHPSYRRRNLDCQGDDPASLRQRRDANLSACTEGLFFKSYLGGVKEVEPARES